MCCEFWGGMIGYIRLAMICEIQLNLSKWCDVQHLIHRFYSVARCEKDNQIFNLLLNSMAGV